MVLGLIDFLIGGRKNKKRVAKTAQVATPISSPQSVRETQSALTPQSPAQELKPQVAPTQAVQQPEPQVEQAQVPQQPVVQEVQAQPQQRTPVASNPGQKKSLSETIYKIHEEIKSTNERIGEVVKDMKSVEVKVNELTHRVTNLEESKNNTESKFNEIDNNLNKFLSLYELINNEYNPFVEKQANNELQEKKIKEIVLENQAMMQESGNPQESQVPSFDELKKEHRVQGEEVDINNLRVESHNHTTRHDIDDVLLSLDTLDIEEAAGDAVPLIKLKSNTNSLVTILSWLEYLIKKVGINETKNTLRYYTEVLRWISPEVYFELDKYLRGMKDKKTEEEDSLTVRDHIVSLYFISKLNEKTLDSKLTKAVLQIIKQ